VRSAEEAASPQPATTGGLPETSAPPEISAPPEATVTISLNKPKARARASRPIGGWHVHKVEDDTAIVQGKGAHYEVRVGELLPSAGIVRSIKKRGQQWVVFTSKGIITEPR
jgi:hypothetical protein